MIARLFVVGCALIIPSSMILGSPLDFGFAQGWRAQSIAVHSDGGGGIKHSDWERGGAVPGLSGI